MSTRRAAAWSLAWFAAGLALGLTFVAGGDQDSAVSYWTVFLVERSLSLDNLFLFVIILSPFAASPGAQRRALVAGVVIALVLRFVAIAVGAQLLDRFAWVSYVLGGLLLLVAVRMLRGGADEGAEVDDGRILRALRRRLPLTAEADGARFVTRRDGRVLGTPLLVALTAIAVADVTFAVDSIPAAFAITTDAPVIWAANAAALLGLTSLFVLVRALVVRFRYMTQTLAAILVFIAARLLLEDVLQVAPAVSLAGVLGILGAGVALSVLADRRDPPGRHEVAQRRPPRCPPAPDVAPAASARAA